MRVLLVPEVYRSPASACGTLQDAIAWVGDWLERDPHLHVYWLLPPRSQADYEAGDVHADRARATLIEAETLARAPDGGDPVVTDAGPTGAELDALREAIVDPGGYVDVVVDQRREGQLALREWLLALDDNPWAGHADPFDVLVNVHDLQLAFKLRGCGHRDRAQGRLAMAHAAFADGIWFTAGVDREGWRQHVGELFAQPVVDEAEQAALTIASPLKLSRFEETYAETPTTLHLAGSFWAKKRIDELLAVADRLHEERGIETLVTSPEPVPASVADRSWVEAHGEADRATYARALREGDLAICASDYETMARTPFEQAASGQVLVARHAAWTRACTPEDHPLLAPLDELGDLALAVVDDWVEAVEANRRLVVHVRQQRSPQRVGERTHRDLRQRVDAKQARVPAGLVDRVQARASALGEPVELAELLAARPRKGEGPAFARREDVTRMDVVHALRAAGYADRARSASPTFERVRA